MAEKVTPPKGGSKPRKPNDPDPKKGGGRHGNDPDPRKPRRPRHHNPTSFTKAGMKGIAAGGVTGLVLGSGSGLLDLVLDPVLIADPVKRGGVDLGIGLVATIGAGALGLDHVASGAAGASLALIGKRAVDGYADNEGAVRRAQAVIDRLRARLAGQPAPTTTPAGPATAPAVGPATVVHSAALPAAQVPLFQRLPLLEQGMRDAAASGARKVPVTIWG